MSKAPSSRWSRRLARIVSAAAVVGVMMLGCGAPAPAPDPSSPPAQGAQPLASIVVDTDPFEVAPGDEVLMCTVSDVVLAAPFDVETVHGYQSKGGHHAALFYTTEPLSPTPTHRCVDHESVHWQLVGAGAEGQELGLALPPGVAMRIPAGARIAVESHYVNASRQVLHVRDRVTAEPFGARTPIAFAGTFQVTDFAMAIPPHTRETREIECDVDGDMDVIDLNGHAHEWARRVTVAVRRRGVPTFDTLYDQGWEPWFQFHPRTLYYPLDAPLKLRRDERIRVTCTWDNTTDRTLRFPSEMCIGTMHYVPDRGYLRCGAAVSTRDGEARVDRPAPLR